MAHIIGKDLPDLLQGSDGGGEIRVDSGSGPRSASFLAIAGATEGDDDLVGTDGDDVIDGLGGHDRIDGLLGADQLSGGAGDDVIAFSAVQLSSPAPTAVGSIDGGTGFDTVDLSQIWPTQVGVSEGGALSIWVGSQRFGVSGLEKILVGSAGDTVILPSDRSETLEIRAGAGNDSFSGSGAYLLYGEGGDDDFFISGTFGPARAGRVDGGEGLDLLKTNIGFTVDLQAGTASAYSASYSVAGIEDVAVTLSGYASIVSGDAGANRFSVLANGDDGAAGVVFNGRGGGDTLIGGAGFDRLYSHVDPGLYQRPWYGNPFAAPLLDTLAQVDTLSGGAGSDLLSAGYGDNVDGGAGFDSLLISFMGAPAGIVVDFGFLGTQGSVTIGGGVIQGIEAIDWLEGSDYADFIATGPGSASTAPVFGRGGNDHIVTGYSWGNTYGGDGDDIIDRTDSLYGFAHYGEAGNDIIIGSGGYEQLYGGDGDDILSGYSNFDDLYGGDGDDRLDGGSHLDKIFGGAGNDWIYGAGDSDVVDGEDGDDVIFGDYSLISSVNGGPPNNDDTLRGGAGMDLIHGDQGNDTIEGGAGNDLLDGGIGDDGMAGGTGDDVLIVDSAGDSVSEAPDEGIDEVRTALATYSLIGTNLENLTATSDVAHDFRGNAGNNVVTGAAGNDLMRLQDGGDDTAIGGAGNDAFLFIGSLTSADVVDGGAGSDELVLQGDYSAGLTLGAVTGVELIVLVPGSDTRFGAPGTQLYSYSITTTDQNVAAGVQMNVDGNRLRAGENLVFDGSAETDGSFYVFAGKGVDTLTGGAKNDAFLFRGPGNFTGADTVNGGAGFDELALRGDYTGAYAVTFGATTISGIEAIVVVSGYDLRYGKLAGDLSFDLTLNEANVQSGQVMIVDAGTLRSTEKLTFDGSAETDGGRFTMFGGKGNDVLTGGSGADSIRGGLGADVMKGNAGADTFVYRDTAESTTGSVDQILDFLSGTDRIDLSRIDANTLVGGDQAFSWIGSNAFSGSGAAGQLRAYQDGANWFVEGDTNGDGTADLVIQLTGAAAIVQGDFLP